MKSYTTKSGDTATQIAKALGVNLGDISGYKSGDPNKIGVGETLSINDGVKNKTEDNSYANDVKSELTGKTPTSLYDTESIKKSIEDFGTKEAETYKGLENARTSLYNESYAKKGLQDVKSNIASLDEQINAKKNEITGATSNIRGNNRWSSARMAGQLKKATDTANAELSNLISERNSLATNYNDKLKEIDTEVGNQLTDKQTQYNYYSKQKENAQKLLDNYVSQLKDELKRGQEVTDLDKKLASALQIARLRTGGTGTKGLQFVTANSGRKQFVFDPNTGEIKEVTSGKKSSNTGDEEVVFDTNTLPQETPAQTEDTTFLQSILQALGI